MCQEIQRIWRGSESVFLRNRQREELASVITKLIDIPAGITEGSQNKLICRRQYAKSPPPSGLSSQSVSFTGEIYFLLPRRQTGDGTFNLTLEVSPLTWSWGWENKSPISRTCSGLFFFFKLFTSFACLLGCGSKWFFVCSQFTHFRSCLEPSEKLWISE